MGKEMKLLGVRKTTLSDKKDKIAKNAVKCYCPVCLSPNIKDVSTYGSNDILGPGHQAWKTLDVRMCEDCGVMFKPVKENCKDD